MGPVSADDAVEVIRAGNDGRAVFTCEHASSRLPEPWRWPAEDAWLSGTHWTYDLGAADLARELALALCSVAVLSRFSRLLADANRPIDAPDLFRTEAEGRRVALNRDIGPADRARRLGLWTRFHEAADAEVSRSSAPIVFAVHTFTPLYEGAVRRVEAGVLFDREIELAEGLRAHLERAGFRVEMNEPYSGKAGLMYSVERHALSHGRRPIELELRQDLAETPGARRRAIDAIDGWLRSLG